MKLKLTSVILVMVLAAIVLLGVFILSRSNSLPQGAAYQSAEEMTQAISLDIQRRVELFIARFAFVILAITAAVAFFFARGIVKPVSGANVNTHTLQKASEVDRIGLREVAADIQEIARESEGLLAINSLMEDMAGQTNLLSMHAAIEVSHAGEAGKGFAAVADEIRELAESSSEHSKTASVALIKIKESIDKISKSAEIVLARFEIIDENIRTVTEQEDTIRYAA